MAQSEPTPTVLKWTDSEGVVRRIELGPDDTVIGRRTDSDVVVFDMEASRRHARVFQVDGQWFVEDLGSRHGTYVNGRQVEREALQPGDEIRLGRNQFRLQSQLEEADDRRRDPPDMLDETTKLTNVFRELTGSKAGPSLEESGLDKLSLLLDFQYHWKQSFPAEALFQRVLEIALRISGAQRGYVLRRTGNDFQFQVGLDAELQPLDEERFRTSRTVVGRVADSAEPVFMTEGLSPDLANQESIVQQNLRAIACLPLIGVGADTEQSEVLGILYLDSQRAMHGLSGLDERILSKLAGEASNVLEKMEMIRGIEERQQMTKELALARETQRSLLPKNTPTVPGYEIRAFSHPTRYVGGDLYDFFSVGQTTHIVLADVSGKGVAASLLSSSLQGALHMQFQTGQEPQSVLAAVNEYLCARTEDDRFATLVLVSLRPDGRFVFLSAGHIPSYVYRARSRSVEELSSGGLILGMFEGIDFEPQELRLEPGDVLLLLSDGLTEAVGPSDEMFGEQRMADLVRRRAPAGAAALETAIMDALHVFVGGRDQADDITVVAIGRQLEPPPPLQKTGVTPPTLPQ